MTYLPIKYLTREEVEQMAEEAGMSSFARRALLEADFLGCPVRFLLVGNKKLMVQKIEAQKNKEL